MMCEEKERQRRELSRGAEIETRPKNTNYKRKLTKTLEHKTSACEKEGGRGGKRKIDYLINCEHTAKQFEQRVTVSS